MNRISIYFLLVLIYLGLSKSFAPSEQAIPYIPHEHALPHFFPGAPVTVILKDAFKTGFLIHTYLQRYQVVHVFKENEDIYVRTSESFWKKNLGNIGMSIFSRDDKTSTSILTPTPPGLIFIGDPAYGSWELHESGNRVWSFFNAYKSFPENFFWGEFLPTQEFYARAMINLESQRVFYGPEQEFGSNGTVTKEVLDWKPVAHFSWSEAIKNMFHDLIKAFSQTKAKPDSKKTENANTTPPLSLPQEELLEEVKPFLGERPLKNQAQDQDAGDTHE